MFRTNYNSYASVVFQNNALHSTKISGVATKFDHVASLEYSRFVVLLALFCCMCLTVNWIFYLH